MPKSDVDPVKVSEVKTRTDEIYAAVLRTAAELERGDSTRDYDSVIQLFAKIGTAIVELGAMQVGAAPALWAQFVVAFFMQVLAKSFGYAHGITAVVESSWAIHAVRELLDGSFEVRRFTFQVDGGLVEEVIASLPSTQDAGEFMEVDRGTRRPFVRLLLRVSPLYEVYL